MTGIRDTPVVLEKEGDELLQRWNKGYFQTIYEKYSNMVYRICMLYLKSESDAKDGLQDIFLKIWEIQPDFKNEEHVKAWIIQTTKHYCLDILKSNWWKKRTKYEPHQEMTSYENTSDGFVLEQVMSLSAKYREVIYLYYYEEYSVKEISNILHRKESTIQSQLSAGRKKLKKMLSSEEDV